MAWIYRISDQAAQYTLTEAEKQNNAVMIFNDLTSKGWNLNAIAGILGNMESESTINPGACQGGFGIPSGSTIYYSGGLGLIQWTSSPNALLWFANATGYNWYNGSIQCDLLNAADNSGITSCGTGTPLWGWIPTGSYNISYSSYKQTSLSPEDAASAVLYNLERPADPGATVNTRRTQARKWYDYLSGSTPEPPEPPDPPQPPIPSGKTAPWLYFKFDDLRKGQYERY